MTKNSFVVEVNFDVHIQKALFTMFIKKIKKNSEKVPDCQK